MLHTREPFIGDIRVRFVVIDIFRDRPRIDVGDGLLINCTFLCIATVVTDTSVMI